MKQEGQVRLVLKPITLRAARAYVTQKHRHLRAPQGGLFALAAVAEGTVKIVGVAIVGKPVSRHLSFGGVTAEVTRLTTDGTKNVCSFLYGVCWRAARALGYQRLITYTLLEEPGTSLKGAGWRVVAQTKGGR